MPDYMLFCVAVAGAAIAFVALVAAWSYIRFRLYRRERNDMFASHARAHSEQLPEEVLREFHSSEEEK